MNIAYLLYSDCTDTKEYIEGIPLEWVAECRELGDSTALPNDGRSWKLMTKEALDSYKAEWEPFINAWRIQVEADEPPPVLVEGDIAGLSALATPVKQVRTPIRVERKIPFLRKWVMHLKRWFHKYVY